MNEREVHQGKVGP